MDPRLEQRIVHGLARCEPSAQLRSAGLWMLLEHSDRNRLCSNLPRRQWLRLRPLAVEGSGGVERLRHSRGARIRLANCVRVADGRQQWREKQGSLADRNVRREALAR